MMVTVTVEVDPKMASADGFESTTVKASSLSTVVAFVILTVMVLGDESPFAH